MNSAHFHLLVNHIPILLPMVGACILLSGFLFNSEVLKRTAFVLFILAAAASLAAVTSGEEAEEVVENLEGISEDYIEKHEETANLFAILCYILGGISCLALWVSLKQKTYSRAMASMVLLFSLVVIYFGKETGTTGGEIRHTEIRSEDNRDNPNVIYKDNNIPGSSEEED